MTTSVLGPWFRGWSLLEGRKVFNLWVTMYTIFLKRYWDHYAVLQIRSHKVPRHFPYLSRNRIEMCRVCSHRKGIEAGWSVPPHCYYTVGFTNVVRKLDTKNNYSLRCLLTASSGTEATCCCFVGAAAGDVANSRALECGGWWDK
jgi:hypothetical protein